MPCVSVVGVPINEVPITAFEDSPSWSNVHHCGLRPFFAGDALCELQVSFHWRTVSCPILREPHQIIPCSQDRDFLPRLWKVHHNNIFLREVSLKTWKSCVCENICQNRNYRAGEQSNKNIKPDQNIWMVNIWKHCKTCEKKGIIPLDCLLEPFRTSLIIGKGQLFEKCLLCQTVFKGGHLKRLF